MRKILFCLQWYPSFNSANGFCDEEIIRALKRERGYDIHCLTYKTLADKVAEELDGVKVHRFKRGLFWTWYTDQVQNKKRYRRLAEGLYRFLLRIKEVLTIPLYPVYEPILCLRFASAAIALDKKEHFDVVVAEFHGMDSLWAGYCLKRSRPSIKFVPLYWDSLAGGYPAKYLPEKYCMSRRGKMEKRLDIIADRIIALKSTKEVYGRVGLAEDIISKVHFLSIPRVDVTKSKVIRHLPEDLKEFIRPGFVNVLFAGSPGKRSFDYLFELLDGVGREISVNLIIVCRELFHDELLKKGEEYNHFSLLVGNYMPYDKLSCLLSSCDVLLNIGNESKFLVPSKIYDYVSYAKPIMSLYGIDEDTSKLMLQRYPAKLLINERDDLMESVAKTVSFFEGLANYSINPTLIESLYEDATGKAYVKVLNSLQ